MMEYVWMAIIGVISGGIAKMIIGGSNPSGWIITAVLGIAGSFLANFIGEALHLTNGVHSTFMSIVYGVVGASILLVIYHFVQKAQASS